MDRLTWCPTKHRPLARELLQQSDGDEARLQHSLLEFALDTLAGASIFRGAAPEPDAAEGGVPSVEETIEEALRTNGLDLHRFIPGRPTTALVVASGGPVRIGDEDEHQVVIKKSPVPAKVVSLTARGRASSAVFALSVKELRMRDRFAPEGYWLVLFVLRAEARVWAMTRGELLAVDEALRQGEKLQRFSRGPGGLVRVAMPKKPTGLDFTFPRVASWSAGE